MILLTLMICGIVQHGLGRQILGHHHRGDDDDEVLCTPPAA